MPISDAASKTASCLNDWSNKGNKILHRRPINTVCLVRVQVAWCYYMVLLLHCAIRFFVISCSANIYKLLLNWRTLEMSKALFPFEWFNYATCICRNIACIYMLQHWILLQKEMELQAYLVQFFNEMGNKKKKIWEIKRRTHYANCRSCTLSHF